MLPSFRHCLRKLRFSSTFEAIREDDIRERVLSVFKNFNKINKNEDFGLDSLDQVEYVVALEEEFKARIPDDQAEKIQSLGEAVSVIKECLEARQ